MRRRRRKRRINRDEIRRETVKAARAVIDANEYRDHPALTLYIARLSFWLELLAEFEPLFEGFLVQYAARVCAAPDCGKVFMRKDHSHDQRYHSTSCRSRHNMQKRRPAITEEEIPSGDTN